MIEAKFTGGEWDFDKYGNLKANGETLKVSGVCFPCGHSQEETKANMNLIAAAPTHDKVLCVIEDRIPLTPNTSGGDYMITLTQEEVDQIRETLNKARGEIK